MATQAIAGLSGQLFVSSDGGVTYNILGEAKDVTLAIKRDAIDVTSHDSAGTREFIPGTMEWSAKVDGLFIDGNAAQDAVSSALLNGTKVKVRFWPKAGVGLDKYEGDGVITDWELSSPNTEAAQISVSIQGSGVLTKGVQ